jgi:hypothetical protein
MSHPHLRIGKQLDRQEIRFQDLEYDMDRMRNRNNEKRHQSRRVEQDRDYSNSRQVETGNRTANTSCRLMDAKNNHEKIDDGGFDSDGIP